LLTFKKDFPLMATSRLMQQYQKLYQALDGQTTSTTLQELSEQLFCTRRHMRNLLAEMQSQGWINWLSRSGRGGRSTLSFICSAEALQREQALSLLSRGKFEQAVGLLDAEPDALAEFLTSRLGQRWERGRQVLTVPYYRPLPDLLPTALQRRSERHLVRQVFNGLTALNEEKGEIEADLVHHWTTVDQRVWQFHLRPSVRWHDGKRLSMADVEASLDRLRTLPLFDHLRTIELSSTRRLTITLSEPDQWFPWLLAEPYAAILPADYAQRSGFSAHPVGTGPFRVAANDDFRLTLQAFDDYFAYRALIDEVNILIVPRLGRLDSAGTMSIHAEQEPANAGSELHPEQGGYFLWCDGRHPLMGDTAIRHFIGSALSSLEVLHAIPPLIRPYWTPAHSILPGWHHVGTDLDKPVAAPSGLRRLRIAYPELQPDYETIATALRSCLAAHDIALETQALPYADWASGNGEFELWLGSTVFAARVDFAVPAWLFGSQLAQRCLPSLPLPQWLSQWRRGELDTKAMIATTITQHWLLPLAHTWFHLKGAQRHPGVRLNKLGWVDFKSAWLEQTEL
jgi:SgrR family transcriptional regulator